MPIWCPVLTSPLKLLFPQYCPSLFFDYLVSYRNAELVGFHFYVSWYPQGVLKRWALNDYGLNAVESMLANTAEGSCKRSWVTVI